MRLSGIGHSGSISVLMIAIVPICAALLALVVETGRISLARIRLQSAADRAAFAGAASIANSLNRIAVQNWKLNKAWRDLDRDFASDAQQNRETARQRFTRYSSERDALLSEMETISSSIEDRSRNISLGLFLRNEPLASAEVITRAEPVLMDNANHERQWGKVRYGSIEGPIFTDPESVESGEFDALKYVIKNPGPDASVGVIARQRVRPVMLRRILGDGVEIKTTSSAQAFGGSVELFAQKETDSIEDAESKILDDGTDDLYRPAIVPIWTIGEQGNDMRH